MSNMTDPDFIMDWSKPVIEVPDLKNATEMDFRKYITAQTAYIKLLEKRYGKYKPMINVLEKPTSLSTAEVVWWIVTNPWKIVKWLYYIYLLLTKGEKMWETIKLMLFVNWRSTATGIITATVPIIISWIQSGNPFDPVYMGFSLVIIVLSVIMPDAKWLLKILEELRDELSKKKDK